MSAHDLFKPIQTLYMYSKYRMLEIYLAKVDSNATSQELVIFETGLYVYMAFCNKESFKKLSNKTTFKFLNNWNKQNLSINISALKM